MKYIVTIFFVFQILFSFSQSASNQIDSLGRKQGLWQKEDIHGRLVYEAEFIDDHPVGKMKRFHPNGQVKALMMFTKGSDTVSAILFDEKGNKLGEGSYLGQEKVDDWNYYSKNNLISSEHYFRGKKDGISKKYYHSGELLEESQWKNGMQNGCYKVFNKQGKLYLECSYNEGFRDGILRSYYNDGAVELEVNFKQDLRDGDCTFYNPDGTISYILKYDHGVILNPEVQDSIERNEFNGYRKNDLPDPEKFMQNPEEYMRMISTYRSNR